MLNISLISPPSLGLLVDYLSFLNVPLANYLPSIYPGWMTTLGDHLNVTLPPKKLISKEITNYSFFFTLLSYCIALLWCVHFRLSVPPLEYRHHEDKVLVCFAHVQPQHQTHCLAHDMPSTNICWVNEWMNEWGKNPNVVPCRPGTLTWPEPTSLPYPWPLFPVSSSKHVLLLSKPRWPWVFLGTELGHFGPRACNDSPSFLASSSSSLRSRLTFHFF